MLTITEFRITCLSVSSRKTQTIKTQENSSITCCFVRVWNFTSHAKGRTRIEGILRTGCWGEYLDLRGRTWREAGGDCIMWSFITCTLHKILQGAQMEEDEMVVHAARMGKMRHVYKTLVWIHEEKRSLGTLSCGWKDHIKMDLRKIGWEDVDWMHVTNDKDQWRALINTVMNFREP